MPERPAAVRIEDLADPLLPPSVVEMMDAGTRSVVWRGLASTDINMKASPEKREKSVNRAAEKLFKHYPPKQK